MSNFCWTNNKRQLTDTCSFAGQLTTATPSHGNHNYTGPLGTHIQTHRWGEERDVTRGIEMGSPQHCHRCRVCHIVVWGYFYGWYRSWDSRNSVAIRHLLTGVLIRPSISLGLNRNWSSGRERTKRWTTNTRRIAIHQWITKLNNKQSDQLHYRNKI